VEEAPPRITESGWEVLLARELDQEVRVSYGRARSRVLQAEHVPGGRSDDAGHLRVRMSAFFAGAPADVQQAVARWLRSGRRARRAMARLDEWIAEAVAALPPAPPAPPPRLRPRGRVHDLGELGRELRAGPMGAALPPASAWPGVTWGRRGGRARHSLLLGSYLRESNLVRVHPVLDQDWVPVWFVRYILFHELLHAAVPPGPDRGGRTVHHPAAFRRIEERYPDYGRALAWQEAHFTRLLRTARRLPARSEAAPGQRPPSTAAAGPPRQGLLF